MGVARAAYGRGSRGDREAEARSLKRYRLFMGLTLLGGAMFLVVKSIEYSEKFSHDLYPCNEQLPRLCISR